MECLVVSGCCDKPHAPVPVVLAVSEKRCAIIQTLKKARLSSMPCLLVASIFTPINGGSAVVYETLCRFAPPGSMVVLSPWRHYVDGLEIPGWREHDRRAPYPIYRLELLL